ncbi:MAG: DciA family protein [Candidatus Aquicultor sp.]
MYGLGETIRELTSNEEIRAKFEESKVLSVWTQVVGPAISENAAPEKIKHGILYIKTKSPAWAQELKVLDAQIIKQINALLGSHTVHEMRFIHGPLASRYDKEDTNEGAPDIGSIRLTQNDLEHIEELVGEIEPPEMKDRVLRLMVKNKKLEKWRKCKLASPDQGR